MALSMCIECALNSLHARSRASPLDAHLLDAHWVHIRPIHIRRWIGSGFEANCNWNAWARTEVMWYSSFLYHTQHHEAPLKSHEGQRSTGKMFGGWTHTETKALKGLHFQAVRQCVIISWQRIATPLVCIQSFLSNRSFERSQCALNSYCHECEFNTNSMRIDTRYHVNGP